VKELWAKIVQLATHTAQGPLDCMIRNAAYYRPRCIQREGHTHELLRPYYALHALVFVCIWLWDTLQTRSMGTPSKR